MKTSYDVIIIGGGHNGLVTAAYLGKAGYRTLVLERRDILGGASVTEEDVFSGYKISATSYVASLFHPKIIQDLSLHEHGLEFLVRDPPSFTPFADGSHLFSCLEQADTMAEIARFSKRDAQRYAEYEAMLTRIAEQIEPLLLMTPPDPTSRKPRDLWRLMGMGKMAKGLAGDFLPALQLASASVADFVRDWFESDALQSTLATDGIIGAYAGVESPGTAYVLLHHVMGGITDAAGTYHRGRWAYVRGGMGGIPASIVASSQARQDPVDFVTGEPVARIIVEKGRTRGVELTGGRVVEAPTVVSAVDPKITYLRLLAADQLDGEFITQIRNYKMKGATTKVNLVLSELPDFKALPGIQLDRQHCGTIHICENLDYMERAWEDAKHGRWSENPILECTIPTVYDKTLLPPEHPDHHIMNIFVLYGPKKLAQGTWQTEGPKFLDRVIRKLGEFAPNLPDAIVHKQILTPDDLEERYALTEGCIFHGAMGLDQLFWARPLPSIAQYRGPIDGLYMCGSGTHPGGGVTGLPGHNAAREILRDKPKRG
ncbi:MAG: NAD(P)/FAD-dependent oxidoreductase [Gemmatimonadetes bacterium]|jgi:phytoene dehydrogenase-like protein|nr:NAD(P)/FAD-dependent oxidoreductase [Gemmatimonadota bacterium]MBT6150065.1 NAD(P)/FAD-dependent oxidoreductase [Gemmatimonadota bacterium]MBT7861059.1 NAD(P)/FAD-dependent oxidoreductase [Gemmatimonadota bacterium]